MFASKKHTRAAKRPKVPEGQAFGSPWAKAGPAKCQLSRPVKADAAFADVADQTPPGRPAKKPPPGGGGQSLGVNNGFTVEHARGDLSYVLRREYEPTGHAVLPTPSQNGRLCGSVRAARSRVTRRHHIDVGFPVIVARAGGVWPYRARQDTSSAAQPALQVSLFKPESK